MHYAGRDVLFELIRHKKLVPTVVVTGFDLIGPPERRVTFAQMNAELTKRVGANKFRAILYVPSNEQWKAQLAEAAKALLKND
jgi:hypothetical protein